MLNFLSFFDLGNRSNNKRNNKGKTKPIHKRKLALESLENRELLSVTPLTLPNSPFDHDIVPTALVASSAQAAEASSTIVTTLTDVVNANDGLISLREAIDNAGTAGWGTTITFAAALQGQTITLNGSELTINKSVTIDGTNRNITINANQKSRVFSIGSTSTVVLAGLTITGGQVTNYGGGIHNSGILTLTNCHVLKNKASSSVTSPTAVSSYSYGGGIYNANSGTLKLTNSEIAENTASASIIVSTTPPTTIGVKEPASSILLASASYASGGGIYNSSGTLTVTDCKILKNEVFSSASYQSYTYGFINTTKFDLKSYYSSYSYGGGIYNGSGTLTLTNDSIISENKTTGLANDTGGGGIYNSGLANITSCKITKNSVPTTGNEFYGGGIYNSGETNITCCEITGNEANRGGGIGSRTNSKLVVKNSVLAGNRASARGGGIHNSGAAVDVINCTIAGNKADYGGGIYIAETQTRTFLYNTIVSGNVAPNGATPDTDRYGSGVSGFTWYSSIDGNLFRNGNNNPVSGYNPQFVAIPTIDNAHTGLNYKPAEWNLRLKSTSPAINKENAENNDNVVGFVDLAGNPRKDTINSKVDIGAYEYGSVGTPTITVQPASATYVQGASSTALSITASTNGYSGTLSYQWQQSTNGTTWSNITSETKETYTPSTSTIGTTYYRCSIANTSNGHTSPLVYSGSAAISVFAITTQPVSATYKKGETPIPLSVEVTCPGNLGTISYQWQRLSAGSNTWSNTGTNSSTLAASYILTAAAGTTYYRCVVTNTLNGTDSTESASAIISVIDAPTFTTQPVGATYKKDETPTALSAAAGKLAADPGTISYQWQSSTDGNSWNNVGSATTSASSHYTPPTGLIGITFYRCVATNSHGGKTNPTNSDVVTVTIIGAPDITRQPASATYYKGQTVANLSVAATRPGNIGTLIYQWYKNDFRGAYAKVLEPGENGWVRIEGANSGTLSSSLMSKEPGCRTDYYCEVTNTLNGKSIITNSAVATILIDEETHVHSTQNTAYDFGTVETMVGGEGTPYYGIAIDRNGIADTDDDDWYAFTTNKTGDHTSKVKIEFNGEISNINLYLYGPDEMILGAGTVTKVGNVVTSEISLNGFAAGTYKIRIDNSGNKTNTYQLEISPPGSPTKPIVPVNPVSAKYVRGETPTTLTVSTTASSINGVVSYRWESSTHGSESETWDPVISTSSPICDPSTDIARTIYYRCVVINTLTVTVGGQTVNVSSSTASTAAKIEIIDAPVIETQPVSATYVQGETTTPLSVTASRPADLGTLSYQWQWSTNNSTWSDITNAKSATLVASSISTSAAGTTYYRCVVTNSLDGKSLSTNSGSAKIDVIGKPTMTTQPVSATYKQGVTATALSVTATRPANLGTLSYQWFVLGGTQVLSTDSTYMPSTQAIGTTQYFCRVTNSLGGKSTSTDSEPATISVFGVPTVTAQPVSATYKQGETTAALFIGATKPAADPGTLSYQWQSSANNSTWSNISGAISAEYTPSAGAVGTTYYRCIVTNSLNGQSLATNSGSAKVDVIGTPSISQQPQSATYWPNDPATALSVTVTKLAADPGTLSYQWYRNGTAISGATSATYTPSTSTVGETQYFCRVTNSFGDKTTTQDSGSATITVIGIAEQPQSGSYDYREPVILSVQVAGSSVDGVVVEYLWQKYSAGDNTWRPLTQGSSRNYTLPIDSVGTTQYRCLVSVTMNGIEKDFTSNTATVEIQSQKLVFDEIAKTYIYGAGHKEGTGVTYAGTTYAGWTVDTIFNEKNYLGLYAEGLKNTNGESLLVFRGTQMNSISDILADLDGKGVGYSQYMAAQSALVGWASSLASSSLTVIGHSLGGALAQWFATDFTSQGGKLAGVETFNATGIAKNISNTVRVAASLFNSANCGYVTHHIVNGDFVSMFGDEYIDGTAYLYTVNTFDKTKDIFTAVVDNFMDKHAATFSELEKIDGNFNRRTSRKQISVDDLSSNWFVYSDLSYLTAIAATTLVTSDTPGKFLGPSLLFRGSAEILRTNALSKLKEWGNLFGNKNNFVGIDTTKLSQGQVTFKGQSIGMGDSIGIVGAGLKDAEITYNWTTGKIEVKAELKFGTGGIGFPIMFGWDLSKHTITAFGAGFEFADPGFQLSGPPVPLYLQMLGGGITLPPDWEVGLYTRLTVGPEVKDKALITINAGLTFDSNSIKISTNSKYMPGDGGIIIVNKNTFYATGSLEYNWTQNYFKGQVNAKLLKGLGELDAVMKIWNNNGVNTIVMAGDMTVRIPKEVKLIGGWEIGKAGVGVKVTDNGKNSDDYVLVATSIDIGFKIFGKYVGYKDIGAKFYFDGDVDIVGASLKKLDELKKLAKSAPVAAAAMIDGQTMSLENPNLLVLDWGYTNENPLITFKLSDGRILTEAEMIANGYISLVDELSSDTRRTYGVLEFSDIDIAQWEYTLDGDAAAITPELWGLEENLDVQAKSITGGNDQPYRFDVNVLSGESNASPDTILTFYLNDANERDFNGVEVWRTTLGELQNGGWTPSEDLAPGIYSLYVVAEDGNKVPAKAYFEETISIGVVDLDPPKVTVEVQPEGSLKVEWNGDSNALAYIVQWNTVNDFTGTILGSEQITDPNTTDFLIENLPSGKYWVQVIAKGDGVTVFDSPPSEVKSATISTTPNTPTNFTSTAQTPTTITLQWDAQSGVTEYIFEYKKTSNSKWTTLTAPAANATSTTVIGLTADTAYEFRLTAINDKGSATSTINNISTTIPEAIPGVKTVAKASGVKKVISLSSITLTWKQNTAKNTHYKVTCTTPGVTVEIGEITVINGRYFVTITGLQPGTKYKFEIVAYNGTTAAKPTKVSVKTKTYAAVTNVKKTISGTTVNWTWADHKLKFPETTHYELLDASDKVVETVTTNAVSKDLTSGTHKFSIRAVVKDAEENILFASKLKKISVKIR